MIVTFVTRGTRFGGRDALPVRPRAPTAEEADRLAAACEAPIEKLVSYVARHRPPCQRAVHPDLEGHPLARATFQPNILAILAPRIGFELMGWIVAALLANLGIVIVKLYVIIL